ncbi:MAG: LLM class flavin-dependent oxidoreductase [Betaproteobacteria bacterium]|nr:LLM class flavin-dependent oxidoreductase [Betaproteobacteria bacterium]
MRLDLFHEIALPPHLGRTEAQAYGDTLAELELADELGFGCAWLVEHHFMPGYSHCSKPELVLAAAAARTRRLRLGLAVIPLPLHHPVHVAERVATLDVLSGGRLEAGIGRGFSPAEFAAFQVPMSESRERVRESLDILRLSFSGSPVSYRGKHYRLDAREILPHCLQAPHPPLWTAAVSPDTFEWAAGEGMGILAGPFKPWLMVKHDIARFRSLWNHAAPPRIGMTVGILCLKDGRRARELAAEAIPWFYRELYRTTLPVLEGLYPSYEHFHELGRFRQLLKLGINLTLLETFGMAVVGTPQECIEKLKRYQSAGVTNLLCAVGAGAVPSGVARESMRCLAEKVMPAFREHSGPRP